MTGETWGISGPVFLAAYVLLAGAVLFAGTRARRALADPMPDRHRPGSPYEVALLGGGAEQAVAAAVTALHVKGTVVPLKGRIQAVGRLDPGADALERAIHFATGAPVQLRRLPAQRAVRTALDTTTARLVEQGLLLSDAQRRGIRSVGRWLAAVAGIGLLRLLSGLADGRPAGFLVVALLGVAVVAALQLSYAPRRTRSGDRLIARLRDEHHELDPTQRPDWVAYGPAAAALGVGIFGTGAMWASDPAFAEEIALQRTTGGSGDGGSGGTVPSDSGGGGGDGGGGGCGGGCGG